VVARHLLEKLDQITAARIANAAYFDEQLSRIPQVVLPVRDSATVQVYHLYMVRCLGRDALQRHLIANGVDAKVHYPVPMHLQPAAAAFGYKRGDFPIAEAIADTALSLPVHEFITRSQQDRVVELIREFYA